jgi:DNA/RNA-binding domain of Phe-tRNA-synthetase-like protein
MKPGDMMISDACGSLLSVVYGPDQRTRITPETSRVLFTVYAPPGIKAETVRLHLEDIRANVLVVSPAGRTEVLEVLVGD